MNLLPKEAADRLRTTTGTLANLRCAGGGPRYLKLGRRVLYPVVELEKWEQQQLRSHTAQEKT
jgi:hypothetical protein